jgi:hypothetical protein
MSALKELLAVFTFKVEDSPLKKANASLANFGKSVVGAFAAAEIIGGIRNFTNEMFAVEGQITDTSDALGVSRQGLQEWGYIASRGGASIDDVSTAMKVLQKNAVDGSAAFKKIGVDVKGADGNIAPIEDLLFGVAQGLSEVENPAERTKLALELLGKGGTKLNSILSKGPEELEALRSRYKELGGGLTEEMLDGIGGAADAMDDMEVSTRRLKGGLMLYLAPAIRTAANWIGKFVSELAKGDAMSTRLKAALVTLGIVAAVAGAAMLAPYLPFLLAIAAIYLIVQDFYTFLEGGDSVTGKVLDWLFGEGSAEEIRKDLKNLSKDWKKFVDDTEKNQGGTGFWDLLEEGFSQVGANIVKFFVEDLPEAVKLAASQAAAAIKEGATSMATYWMDGLSPAKVISAAADLGKKIVKAIVGAIGEQANQIGAAIVGPLGSVVIPTPGSGGDGGGGGVLPAIGGTIVDTVVPGGGLLRSGYNKLFGSTGSVGGGSLDIRRNNNVRIDIHGAPDSRGLARELQPHVNSAINDDSIDAMGLDLEGMA